jgi:hypothetical protein
MRRIYTICLRALADARWAVLVAAVAIPIAAYALPAPIKSETDIYDLMCSAAGIIFNVAITLSIIMVLYSAFLFLTSSGDENKVSTARRVLIYAAVGVAVALFSGGIPLLTAKMLNVSLVKRC